MEPFYTQPLDLYNVYKKSGHLLVAQITWSVRLYSENACLD